MTSPDTSLLRSYPLDEVDKVLLLTLLGILGAFVYPILVLQGSGPEDLPSLWMMMLVWGGGTGFVFFCLGTFVLRSVQFGLYAGGLASVLGVVSVVGGYLIMFPETAGIDWDHVLLIS